MQGGTNTCSTRPWVAQLGCFVKNAEVSLATEVEKIRG